MHISKNDFLVLNNSLMFNMHGISSANVLFNEKFPCLKCWLFHSLPKLSINNQGVNSRNMLVLFL